MPLLTTQQQPSCLQSLQAKTHTAGDVYEIYAPQGFQKR